MEELLQDRLWICATVTNGHNNTSTNKFFNFSALPCGTILRYTAGIHGGRSLFCNNCLEVIHTAQIGVNSIPTTRVWRNRLPSRDQWLIQRAPAWPFMAYGADVQPETIWPPCRMDTQLHHCESARLPAIICPPHQPSEICATSDS